MAVIRSALMAAAARPCWHIAGTSRFRRIAAAFAALRGRAALTCTDRSGLLRFTSGFGAETGLLMRLGFAPFRGSCKELRCLISAGVPGLHEHPRLVR